MHVLPSRSEDKESLHLSQGLTKDPVRDSTSRKWLRLGLLLSLTFSILTSLNFSLLLLSRTPRYLEEVRLKKALGRLDLSVSFDGNWWRGRQR